MDKKLFNTLLTGVAVSGAEFRLQKKIAALMKEDGFAVSHDYSGNLFASINEDAKFQVLLTGHIDENGFLVTDYTAEGYLKVLKAGGINERTLQGKRVRVFGDKEYMGVFGDLTREANGSKLSMNQMYIDCGFKDKKEAKAHVAPGSLCVNAYDYDLLLNDRVAGRALDDRLGAYTVLMALKRARELGAKVGVTACCSVGEETTMRGAFHAAAGKNPDLAIASDVFCASDAPDHDAASSGEIKLGKGTVLVRSSALSPKVYERMEETCKKYKIPYQIEVTGNVTHTDADRMHVSAEGVPVFLVSIPLRYVHSPSEVADLKDVEAGIELLGRFLAELPEDYDPNPFK